jgi:hypothetical protein
MCFIARLTARPFRLEQYDGGAAPRRRSPTPAAIHRLKRRVKNMPALLLATTGALDDAGVEKASREATIETAGGTTIPYRF